MRVGRRVLDEAGVATGDDAEHSGAVPMYANR